MVKRVINKVVVHKKIVSIPLIIGIFLVGMLLGEYLQKKELRAFIETFRNVRINENDFSLINPLLGSVSAPATDVGIFSDMKDDILSFLIKEKKMGNIDEYSLYFKELNSPLWFGVNEEQSFAPASLFKLPVAIAIYKKGEDDPSFLKKKLTYTKEVMEINKAFQTNEESKLELGKSYNVEDLVVIMLENSDNGAKDLLMNDLDSSYISNLFSAINISDSLTADGYQISPRKYAFFLRLLYNSSYLNEQHSEKILSILTKANFREGIVSGVPEGVKVAQKFGIYDLGGNFMLHDCGIVYKKEDQYILCIMTKGRDTSKLSKIFSHLSSVIYERENE